MNQLPTVQQLLLMLMVEKHAAGKPYWVAPAQYRTPLTELAAAGYIWVRGHDGVGIVCGPLPDGIQLVTPALDAPRPAWAGRLAS